MVFVVCVLVFFLFKQKTAYEMRISDWSSDVCSSDLQQAAVEGRRIVADHPECRNGEAGDEDRVGRGPAGIVQHGQHRGRGGGLGALVRLDLEEIGSASCRERVCPDVDISVVRDSLNNKKNT